MAIFKFNHFLVLSSAILTLFLFPPFVLAEYEDDDEYIKPSARQAFFNPKQTTHKQSRLPRRCLRDREDAWEDYDLSPHPKPEPEPVFEQPCGIHLLSTRSDRNGSLSFGGMRDYDFVKGYVLRIGWTDIEKSSGVYDFSAIENILLELEALKQTLTLQLIGSEPDHIAENAIANWTWFGPNPRHSGDCADEDGCSRPLPWDAYSLERQQAMLQALADHQMSYQGADIRLADHPLLDQVLFSLVGWGRIREIGFQVENWPDYSRQKLITATLDNMRMHHLIFPNIVHQVMIWPVQDDDAVNPLWTELLDKIAAEFGAPDNPSIIVLQENLQHSDINDVEKFGPNPDGQASPISYAVDKVYTGFQMLTSWDQPFTSGNQVTGGNPISAMEWANETWETRYFELYTQDADAAFNGEQPWLTDFQRLSDTLCD